MKIEDMTMEEVEARLAEITSEVETRSGEELDALKAEVVELQARKQELADIEQRAQIAKKLESGEVKPEKVIEERKVEDKMAQVEVRNTLEYGRAFLKGDLAECRSMLTTGVGGTVAVPELLETEIKNAWENCEVLSLAKHTSFKGNVKVGFEYSATGAVVHVEGTAAPEEETLIWGTVELKPQNIKKWITVSDEAIEGTTIDTLGEIYKEVAQRIVEAAEEIAVGKIIAAPATSTQTACGVPVYQGTTLDVDTITMAVAEISGRARNLVAIMNRRTAAAFKSAAKKNKYGVDPFDGIRVVHTDYLKAYSAAETDDTYVIIGDFGYGFQANFPNGNGVILKTDELSLAEKDLVKIVGRQYVGMGVVAPKAFVKITK